MANKEDIAMDDAILETYGGVMATILTIGVVGNFTFLLVLFQVGFLHSVGQLHTRFSLTGPEHWNSIVESTKSSIIFLLKKYV